MRGPCGRLRVARGASLRPSLLPRNISCRRTISRKIRNPSSRTAHLPRISDSICSQRWPRAISVGWDRRQLERIEATFKHDGRMELFRGHLYNWYDTHDLRPLDPKYVSTVDSGNMAGHLLTLASGCRELIQKSSVGPRMFDGIEDAIVLLRESLAEVDGNAARSTASRGNSSAMPSMLAASIRSVPRRCCGMGMKLSEVIGSAHTRSPTLRRRWRKNWEIPPIRNCASGPRQQRRALIAICGTPRCCCPGFGWILRRRQPAFAKAVQRNRPSGSHRAVLSQRCHSRRRSRATGGRRR